MLPRSQSCRSNADHGQFGYPGLALLQEQLEHDVRTWDGQDALWLAVELSIEDDAPAVQQTARASKLELDRRSKPVFMKDETVNG